jgi:hypothetical protein
MILVNYHHLSVPEAEVLESELLAWFLRFCRRVGRPDRMRALLLVVCNHLAREYKKLTPEGAPVGK